MDITALMQLNGLHYVTPPQVLSTRQSKHTVRPYPNMSSPCVTRKLKLNVELVIAKHEPPPPNPQHHGHLTALSITPTYRSLGLARIFMDLLETMCAPGKDRVDAWFVDLFVRCNNVRAIEMYEKLGYSVFRRVVE